MSVITVLVQPDPIVTWEETRIDLRIDATDEQDYVESLIEDATSWVQARIGRAIGLQVVAEAFDDFDDTMALGVRDVVSFAGVYGDDSDPLGLFYLDAAGDEQTVATTVYGLNGNDVFLRSGQAWATDVSSDVGSVVARYQSGYATVPGGIRQAIRLLTRIHYERREPDDDEQRGLDALLLPYQVWT